MNRRFLELIILEVVSMCGILFSILLDGKALFFLCFFGMIHFPIFYFILFKYKKENKQ